MLRSTWRMEIRVAVVVIARASSSPYTGKDVADSEVGGCMKEPCAAPLRTKLERIGVRRGKDTLLGERWLEALAEEPSGPWDVP